MDTAEFENHPLWETVKATEAVLAGNPTAGPSASMSRLQALAAHLLSYKAVPAALLSSPIIQGTLQAWSNIDTHVNNYVANSNNPAYLDQAMAYADQVLSTMSPWPEPITRSDKGAAATRAYRELAEQMQAQTDAYAVALATARDQQQQDAAKHAADLAAVEQERAKLSQRLSELETQADAQVQSLRDAAAAQSSKFNEDQAQRAEAYKSWLGDRLLEHTQALTDSSDRLSETQRTGAALLADMRTTQAQTEKVAGNTTSAVLARDFGSYSQREFWSAIGAFVIGVLAILWAGYLLVTALAALGPTEAVTWQWVTLKIGVTVTIVGGASVAITLGNKFLKNSVANKRVELELRAIGPFLTDVDDEESARKVKLDFVEKTFGHAWDQPPGKSDDDDVNVNALTKVLGAIAPFLSRST